jgi:TMEM175 potassium channel family protein
VTLWSPVNPETAPPGDHTPNVEPVEKDRVQAFSDGVIAILITIMVLELKIPQSPNASELGDRVPIFLTYVLSFVYLGIYWNNHHHLLMATKRVNGAVLWANLHLLFWLSLFPFFTGWMGENHFAKLPTAAYGVVLSMAGVAYYVLKNTIIAAQGPDSALATALGRDVKGKISPLIYAVAVPLAFLNRWIAVALYIVVALMWLVPDRRIESNIDLR